MATDDIIFEAHAMGTNIEVHHASADLNYGRIFWISMQEESTSSGCAIPLYRIHIERLLEQLKRALDDTSPHRG